MKRETLKVVLSFFLFFFTNAVFAAKGDSFGSLARDFMGPADTITKLVHLVCIIVGIILLFMSISMFKASRFNPKFVPLERPIIIAILGIFLLALPFYGKIFFHPTGGIHDAAAAQGICTDDPDAPLMDDWISDYDH